MDDALTAQTRDAYDVVAAQYAQLLPDTRYEADLDLAMIGHFVQQLGGPAEVLDAGCGTGRMIGHLHSLGGDLTVTGVDLSPAMLDRARAAHPDTVLLEGELARLPVDDAQFDGVLAWYSIIHTPPHDLDAAFSEFFRVLRPGGLVLLGYQVGIGDRIPSRPYGHDVELRAFLHHTPYVAAALTSSGFAVDTRLDRAARSDEQHAQGFVLARRA